MPLCGILLIIIGLAFLLTLSVALCKISSESDNIDEGLYQEYMNDRHKLNLSEKEIKTVNDVIHKLEEYKCK